MSATGEQFVEQLRIAFAMHCDDHGLTVEQGEDLADRIADALQWVADDRREVLPAAMGGRA